MVIGGWYKYKAAPLIWHHFIYIGQGVCVGRNDMGVTFEHADLERPWVLVCIPSDLIPDKTLDKNEIAGVKEKIKTQWNENLEKYFYHNNDEEARELAETILRLSFSKTLKIVDKCIEMVE